MSQANATQRTEQSSAPETFQSPMPDSKRTALLRYMIIMFAVAFVLVLMSMVLQVRSSNSTITELHQSSTSALTKAKQLQDSNRDLQDQNRDLQKQLEAADTSLTNTQAELTAAEEELTETQELLNTATAQLQNAWKSNETLTAEKENIKTAYTALARVLMGPNAEQDTEYAQALETLERNKQYLDPTMATLYEQWCGKQVNTEQ